MKNIIPILLFCLPLGAWAQEIMTVHKTDGSTVDFYVDEVQRVTFATRELVNQYDLNGTLSDVAAVLEWHDGDSLTYMLNATGEGTLQPSAPVAVRIAAAGKAVTPGGAVEICRILGREETLRRLNVALEKLS